LVKTMKMKLLILITILIMLVSCERDVSTLDPASFPATSEIYIDGLPGDLDYQAFLNSKLDALSIDNEVKYDGTSSIKITVPRVGDPSGWFAGGVLVSPGRDLSGFNALTFWAKASQAAIIGELGFGNNNSGVTDYLTILRNTRFTTSWQKFVIPIPNSSKLTAEQGIFYFSIGADENEDGFDVWFDEVQFENLGTLAHPQAKFSNKTVSPLIGDTLDLGNMTVSVSGSDAVVEASMKYLDFIPSNDSVVVVDGNDIIVVGGGEVELSAKLGDLDADGKIILNVGNLTAAPSPNIQATDVISLFSNEYTNVNVDTFNPFWGGSTTKISEINIGGDDIIQYTSLNYVGILTESETIDISEMTNLHLQIWTPDIIRSSDAFRVELVDFGPNNTFDGGDDSKHIYSINANSSIALVSEEWITIDIPISELTGLTSKKNIAQIVLSTPANANPNTVNIDNLLFYKK
jgi:hypothetical protein